MTPAYLPVTDDWAESSVAGYYKNLIVNQIVQQYPNLPQQNRDALVEREYQNFLEQNKQQIEQDIVLLSQQYKAAFQDENKDIYPLDIDSYLWYSEARNVVNYGHLGDKLIDGESYFTLRDGRLDKKSSMQLHPYFTAYVYKVLHFFNKDLSLLRVLALMPTIIIGLSVIPIFFIGRIFAGNVGGFFAAMFLVVSGPVLSRTISADTDIYHLFFPLFISWFILEAYTTDRTYLRLIFAGISGFFVGLYAITWAPGWSSIFLIILGAMVLSITSKILIEYLKNKQPITAQKNYIYKKIMVFIAFFFSTGIFVSLLHNFELFKINLTRPIRFIAIKEVGITTIWPNVMTTVAEFNTTSFSNIINQMGGKPLFTLAIIGLFILLIKKKKEESREYFYFIFMVVWLLSSAYAFTKGMRFVVLAGAPFALGLGSFSGFVYEKSSSWINKEIRLPKYISKTLIFALIALLLISPFSAATNIAKQQVPLLNDGWYNTLTEIKNDSNDSIITSWWDYGHFFVAIAERRVTFDGGDQGERIHWVGKILRTDNEAEAVGILRMLNCAQETAPHKLDEFTKDSLKSIEMLYKIFPISDRNLAKSKYVQLGLTKEQAEIMLDYTHCTNLLPNYFITSEDMVSKSGVWGHFGSWNFEKATMYQTVKKINSKPDAIEYLIKNFNLSEEQADLIYSEIQSTPGDQWISPWPGYLSGMSSCDRIAEDKLSCVGSLRGSGDFAFQIDLKNYEVAIENNKGIVPNSIVYATKEKIEEKTFIGQKAGFSIILIPDGNEYKFLLADPLQAASTFTKLFFLEGHGMKCFSKFYDTREPTGGRIITWKVDYNCQQENKVFFSS
ncbi:MAG: STT3 domain-containing protein [Nanoarchaeota archaeon]